MKRTIIITSKTALANYLKERLKSVGEKSESISIFKQIPSKQKEVEFYFIDEVIALRGFKKQFRSLLKLREENKNCKIIILGNDDLTNRMRTILDGADHYLALQMLTSPLFDEYLAKVIYKN